MYLKSKTYKSLALRSRGLRRVVQKIIYFLYNWSTKRTKGGKYPFENHEPVLNHGGQDRRPNLLLVKGAILEIFNLYN